MATAQDVLSMTFLSSSIDSATNANLVTGKLAPGQPVTLNLTFPPQLNTPGTPLFSASATWGIYSDPDRTKPMVEGKDYMVLSDGGLTGDLVTLVFKPPPAPRPAPAPSPLLPTPPDPPPPEPVYAYLRAVAVIKAYAAPVAPLTQGTLTAATAPYDAQFEILELEHAALGALVQEIVDLLYVEVPQLIVNPGDVVTARVARRKSPNQPQVLTSLLHDAPSVEIRGSIPLDNILNFILEPFTKIGSVVPSGNPMSKTDDVTANIRKLLPSALTVPLRLDIRGQRLTSGFAPLGDNLPISFSRTPDESGGFQGFAPIGKWPLAFAIPDRNGPVAGVEWDVTYTGPGGENLPCVQPATSFGMLRNLLFFPRIQALGTPAISPGSATIKIKPWIQVGDSTLTSARHPEIALEVSPLNLPEVLACFEHGFNDDGFPGVTKVFVSRETGQLAGSLDELLQLLGNLSAVLGDLIALLSTAAWGDPPEPPIPGYGNVVYLNQAVKMMSSALTKAAAKGSIPYQIAEENVTFLRQNVSSFIAIAPRPLRIQAVRVSETGRELVGHLIVAPAPGSSTGTRFYSSIVSSLNHANFQDAHPVPAGSTVATPATGYNYNDRLVLVQFVFAGLSQSASETERPVSAQVG